MELEKIQNTAPKIPELVMQSLLAAMEKGEIRVQEELPPERDLSASLGVSRSSLRECLAILEYMSVLETRGNRKIIIKDSAYFRKAVAFIKLSTQNMTLLDLLEFRRTMEVAGVRLACRRATERELEDILTQGAAVADCIRRGADRTQADRAFHAAIVRAAHNEFMMRLLPMIDRAVETAISAGEHKEALAQITLQDHALLLEFIQKRDGEGAEHAMAIHMRHAVEELGVEGL